MTNIKDQTKDIINKAFSFETIDEFVCSNITTDVVSNQLNSCYSELVSFFSSLSTSHAPNPQHPETQDNQELQNRKEAIQELVTQIFQQQHTKKQLLIIRLVTRLVNTKIIEVRFVCEFLLNNLVYSIPSTPLNKQLPTNPYIWCKVLECIKNFISLHDYKSCRDIFKMLLEVVKKIPHENSSLPPQLETEFLFPKSARKHKLISEDNTFDDEYFSLYNLMNASPQTDDLKLESLYETLNFLLDSKNYFMPRYLAINEIKTVLTFGKEAYHKRFHGLFTKFIESFIPTGHLISVSGRDRLLPIVGFSNLYSLYSFWRYNPLTCKFNTSGPLPYFKHVTKPHHEFFYYILKQNTPQYLLLGLMSLNRNSKTRYPVFEEEFANSIIHIMELTEQNPNKIFDNLRIWNNLVNHFVYLNQIIHLPSLIHHISIQLKKKKNCLFKESRDWFMWFFLMIMVTITNKNYMTEFSDLFDILYKDAEILPRPDLNNFFSVIKMAPVSVWILLNNKFSAQEGAQGQHATKTSNKPLLIPEIVRNHLTILQDCLTSHQQNLYSLSLCLNAYCNDTTYFLSILNNLLDKIGKNAQVLQQPQMGLVNSPSGMASPNSSANSIFTNHQPLSIEIISSLTLHVRFYLANYLTAMLIQKTQQKTSAFNLNIPVSIVETLARLIIYDPDNFIKYLNQNLWQGLLTTNLSNLPQLQPNQMGQNVQLAFFYQQMNLLIELITFRLKHLSFTHRTTFLILINGLYSHPSLLGNPHQGQQSQQQNPNQPQLQQPPRQDQINFIKHPIIYLNSQYAMLKLLSSFSGWDYFELLNSIHAASKHAPKFFINPESEEINKAIVMVIARAIHLTSSDLFPFENKEKDDALRSLLRDIMQKTPIYFHDYTLEYFPKVIQDFFRKEQQQLRPELFYTDSSNRQYKLALKKKVDEDLTRFLDSQHSSQVLPLFLQTNQIMAQTILCVFFNILLNHSYNQNLYNKYLLDLCLCFNSNGLDNKKMTQSLRTFCDYLIIECTNKTIEVINNYCSIVVQMITNFNLFTYDRFLFIMTFRSFDENDSQLCFKILDFVFIHNTDFINKFNHFFNRWNPNCNVENDEWDPNLYAQYIQTHPEKFYYEGLREKCNIPINETIINTYYGNLIMRCVPVLDFLNNKYIEMTSRSDEAENLLDKLNHLYKFHNNPLSYVYNTCMYYNNKFQNTNNSTMGYDLLSRNKKKRLFFILTAQQSLQFSHLFSNYLSQINQLDCNNPDLAHNIDYSYYYNLIQRLVKRMLDQDTGQNLTSFKSEFQNPSCHMLYVTLCELISLELFTMDPNVFTKRISTSIIEMFFIGKFQDQQYYIDSKEFDYWSNAAGMIISSLPEPYWYSIYEIIAETMRTDEILNRYGPLDNNQSSTLFDQFDLFLADEKNCFNRLTLVIALFHSIWCHANANHFQYFFRFLKERREELVKTEYHFLFICKLVGPFLSKIHIENTNLLIDLAEELYDMIYLVDKSSEHIYNMETICNFFYHLKYRHIGESIKEKIHSVMPNFRPELKTLFKYITSELNQQLQSQQQQQQPQPQRTA
ncbi:unnamed protein product [Brachionus calyciflorus]|uniref:Mediator of RNA polymerase II transcription subunit 23 n=1 Tax=Brachionus calyciflorus TaxID=104777 RepID=A0A813N9C5_9BILA|nr:unnamed protein product [Brachionus calyciflorus]